MQAVFFLLEAIFTTENQYCGNAHLSCWLIQTPTAYSGRRTAPISRRDADHSQLLATSSEMFRTTNWRRESVLTTTNWNWSASRLWWALRVSFVILIHVDLYK